MEKLIATLKEKYDSQISSIDQVGSTEIKIVAKPDVDAEALAQSLKDHFVELAGELTIVKTNIFDSHHNLVDSFASNQ